MENPVQSRCWQFITMNREANGTIAGLARSVDAGSGGAAHCDLRVAGGIGRHDSRGWLREWGWGFVCPACRGMRMLATFFIRRF